MISVILVGTLIPKCGPFLSLVISSVHYRLIAGIGAELMIYIIDCPGKIFSSLAIVVFSEAVIAKHLKKTGYGRIRSAHTYYYHE